MEKGNGEPERAKKEKSSTYTFSNWMVLQTALMATEVEQQEFMFWYNFLQKKTCEEGLRLKTEFCLSLHVQIHNQLFLPQRVNYGYI